MLTRLGLILIAALVIAVAVFLVSSAGGDDTSEEFSYVGTWRSGVIPAASSPGRVITMTVRADNDVVMLTDFQNNQPPVSEEGQWATDAGALVVTLSTTNGNPLFRPVRLNFERVDDTTIRSVGPSDFGSEGITLRRQ